MVLVNQAVEAVFNVLNLSDGKRVDLISLTKLVEEVEVRSKSANDRATPQPESSNVAGIFWPILSSPGTGCALGTQMGTVFD